MKGKNHDKKIRSCACGCCGREAFYGPKTWNMDREGSTCLRCHMEELRKSIQEFWKSKQLFRNSLSEENQIKWDALPGYKQKYIIGEAWKDGILTYKIGNK